MQGITMGSIPAWASRQRYTHIHIAGGTWQVKPTADHIATQMCTCVTPTKEVSPCLLVVLTEYAGSRGGRVRGVVANTPLLLLLTYVTNNAGLTGCVCDGGACVCTVCVHSVRVQRMCTQCVMCAKCVSLICVCVLNFIYAYTDYTPICIYITLIKTRKVNRQSNIYI